MDMNMSTVKKILKKLGGKAILSRDGVLVPDEAAIAEIEASLPKKCDLIIGVGSGVINDLCKIVSFRKHLPYYIVATSYCLTYFQVSELDQLGIIKSLDLVRLDEWNFNL